MTSRSVFLNGGAYCRSAFVAINKTATAGSTGDATEVDGAWISRKVDDYGGLAQSAKLIIAFTTTMQSDRTLTFAGNIQDAAADANGAVVGAGAVDYGDAIAATVVATSDGSPNETVTGTVEIDVNLDGAREFFRPQLTPNLTNSGTDTLEWSCVAVLFGDSRNPQSNAIANVVGA